MYVIKRDNLKEQVMFDEITQRIKSLCEGLDMEVIDPVVITQKVISGLYPGISTVELDNLAAETAVAMMSQHDDFGVLASRIAVSNLHKQTKDSFSDVVADLYNVVDKYSEKPEPTVAKDFFNVVIKHANKLNSVIDYKQDYTYDYDTFKFMEQQYLLKINGKVVERPQQMFMRVAVALHGDDIDSAIDMYKFLSQKAYVHSSPTLFYAGTVQPQLASCYMLTMSDDSIDGIYSTLQQCGIIAQAGGGIGLNVHCIRGTGSYIAGTNGVSNGLTPMLRVYDTLKHVDQGGKKRPGALTVYVEPWHIDINAFLDLKKPTGKDELRARDMNYALWIPDLFMKRVENDEEWSLMCPHECQGLAECWGDEFEQLYTKYESTRHYRKKVKAQDLWFSIVQSQLECGMPHILYKDAVNRKTNQQNLGTIKSGSYSAELVQYSSSEEVGSCCMASISVSCCVNDSKEFDFSKLKNIVKFVTRALNKAIDVCDSLEPKNIAYGQKHRPIGIGAQGLADTFIKLGFPFESEKAQCLNKRIFETIYYGALEASCDLAEKYGPYETYDGSPASKGLLQFDFWNVTPTELWDWTALKAKIAKHGLRNSMVTAQMPTSSTARIACNNESIESFESYVHTKRRGSVPVTIVNHHLKRDLQDKGLWNDSIKKAIISNNGSIQSIDEIPSDLKEVYKTSWEISQKTMLQMAADRGAYLDQSQSLVIHMKQPSTQKLTSMHFCAWKLGLKTGMYKLRTKSN